MGGKTVEEISHEFIPLEERKNSSKEMFFTWFSASTISTTVVTGALAIVIGLNFWGALLSIIVGHAIGATIMALHSAMGPKSGLPQVVQSRAQFGYYGAILPMLIIFIMYMGYGATNAVLVGQGIKETLGFNMNVMVVLSLVPMVAIAIFGQSLLQKSMKIYAISYTVVFIVLSILIISQISIDLLSAGTNTIAGFILMTSICVTWQITYGPYVADHSRFIHPKHMKKTFLYSYIGSFTSSTWLMVVGAASSTLVINGNVMGQIKNMGNIGFLIVLMLSLGVLVINSLNIYGAGIILLSIVSNFIEFKTTARLRIIVSIAIGIVIATLATWGAGDFMNNFQMYLVFVLFFIIPWSTITLTDFYLLRRDNYDPEEFTKKDGVFGKVNSRTLIIYVITIICQIPFMATSIYTGPVADRLGGIDIAWIVGVIVAFTLYILFSKPILRNENKINEVI